MELFNIILGIIIGFNISLHIISNLFLRSNNIGDEEGDFEHFSKSGLLIYKQSTKTTYL